MKELNNLLYFEHKEHGNYSTPTFSVKEPKKNFFTLWLSMKWNFEISCNLFVLFLDVFCSDGSLLDGLTIKQIIKKEGILFSLVWFKIRFTFTGYKNIYKRSEWPFGRSYYKLLEFLIFVLRLGDLKFKFHNNIRIQLL